MKNLEVKIFRKKSIAVIGDSIFIHSGITALIDVVYSMGNSTVIILDNSITGMTGHQENSTTGYTLKGELTLVIKFEVLGKLIVIKRIESVDAYDIANLERIISEETMDEEASLIITKKSCILLKRDDITKKELKIETSLCKSCKECFNIGLDVKISEVHGISQRGRSIVTYVKFKDKIYSPVVEKGTADVILSFELLECARYIN